MSSGSNIKLQSYKKDLLKVSKQKLSGALLDYEEAEGEVREYVSEKLIKELDFNAKKENIVKDKQYLRKKKELYRRYIIDCIHAKDIAVRGYDGARRDIFVKEMIAEMAGYSVLEQAFSDPLVTDIYCIDWKTIFLERGGKNVPYTDKETGKPITFRNKKHYKDVIERFLREAGTEINIGANKIVDFELYGDRGCATSDAVSPRDYTLTLRKHAEEHITLQQLLDKDVISPEMADFTGMTIDGECNVIVAGLTGSGKTTSIRAILDHYVTKNQKRMLVCEDTQELFPKNEHTLELVSVKSDDPKYRVSLTSLIYTALRLKPKYIIVGEVRGEEAQAAVEGMETGHSTIFTMHGGHAWNIINRLVTKYMMAMPSLGIDVVERIIGSAVDYIIIQDAIPGVGRKISSITEVAYDFETKRVIVKDIFVYDFKKKDWILKNKLDEEKANKMMRRGIPIELLDKWVETGDKEKDKADIDDFNKEYLEKSKLRKEERAKRLEEEERAEEERERIRKEAEEAELHEMMNRTEQIVNSLSSV